MTGIGMVDAAPLTLLHTGKRRSVRKDGNEFVIANPALCAGCGNPDNSAN
jgi:hypothetical protein